MIMNISIDIESEDERYLKENIEEIASDLINYGKDDL